MVITRPFTCSCGAATAATAAAAVLVQTAAATSPYADAFAPLLPARVGVVALASAEGALGAGSLHATRLPSKLITFAAARFAFVWKPLRDAFNLRSSRSARSAAATSRSKARFTAESTRLESFICRRCSISRVVVVQK